MIKTKSVYDPVEESDGERILITRLWPRGVSWRKHNISDREQDLAPSKELLRAWNAKEISWEEYERRYKEEMAGQAEGIEKLAEKASRGTITLMCVEKEQDPHCHRHLLKGMIEAKLKGMGG